MSGRLLIEDVYTGYDKADVLEGVSLTIEPGKITCLLGSNGSGKTTLIRSILGLTSARAGRIMFDGADITALPTHKVVAAGIACIPEGGGFCRNSLSRKICASAPIRRHQPISFANVWTRSTACFRGWPNGGRSLRARCPAASRRWSSSLAG